MQLVRYSYPLAVPLDLSCEVVDAIPDAPYYVLAVVRSQPWSRRHVNTAVVPFDDLGAANERKVLWDLRAGGRPGRGPLRSVRLVTIKPRVRPGRLYVVLSPEEATALCWWVAAER